MSELTIRVELTRPEFALHIDQTLALAGITGLFGANGAGKTTLLRIVAGLDRVPAAEVRYAGTAWQDGSTFVPPHRRRIGFVFQEGRLFPHLSVAGNLEFARASSPAPARIAIADVIAAFDLRELLPRRPGALSAGERQRVAIARSLAANPVLVLMDEPLSSVDRRRKGEILPYIERLPATFGLPVLYVTHSLDELARLAHDMVLLDRGRIVARGSVADVLERVDPSVLAEDIERGVLLEGRVVTSDREATRVAIDAQTIRVPSMALSDGARVRFRVMARDVAIATVPPQGLSIRNVLPARIISLTGDEQRGSVDVLLDLGTQHLRARITAEAVRELALVPEQRVFALIKSVAFDSHAPQ